MTSHLQIPEQALAQALSEKLPAETLAALLEHPEIAAELLTVLEQPPFADDYVPRAIAVLFDDVTAVEWQDGQMIYQCPYVAADYEPELIEWLVDGETAYFSVQGREVVNRLSVVPQLNLETLKAMEENPCKPL
ncbi:MAG: hypothetical protein AAF892_11930 [Cyanobacteria bacterium P01_D01_bin.71]